MVSAKTSSIFIAALLVLSAFVVSVAHLDRESLWYDEGWSIGTVHDASPVSDSVTGRLRFVYTSLSGVLAQTREQDVHPPLYYLLLDGWSLLLGESVFIVRLLSALLALPGLAAVYASGRLLFDRRVGLMALLVTGTASFFIYYTREARMYTLLLALAALSMWAFLRWLRRPTWTRSLVYTVLLAALIYTHYVGALVILTQAVYLVGLRFAGDETPERPFLPYMGALVLFAPWLPAFAGQVGAHPAGPLAAALPSDWGTVAALWFVLTSAHGGLFVVPVLLALPRASRYKHSLALLVLWFLLTPVILFALNAWYAPLFQIRYTIAILPAGALLVAYGLRHMWLPRYRCVYTALALFLLLWIGYTQLAMYGELWPEKPRWDEAVRQAGAARDPLEPAITGIADKSVAAYYSRHFGLDDGIAIDMAWRDHTPEEVNHRVAVLDDTPSVWTFMSTSHPQTWDVVVALSDGRDVGYRDTVMNMIFYRFDRAGNPDRSWRFRFGSKLRYD